MRTFVLLLFAAMFQMRALAAEIPMTVENSGSKEVDRLVLQLVSTRPAPHPAGYWGMTVEEDTAVPYMTTQVSNALVRLKAMDPVIFPALVKHLRDDRYSFSDISAAWLNHDVGDAMVEVLSNGHYMYSGYKGRKTPSGSAGYLSFDAYLKDKEPEKWAEWAKDKTRLDIQMDFIDWCVAKEQARGFTDADQEKSVLATYQRARERVRKEYSEACASANAGRASGLH